MLNSNAQCNKDNKAINQEKNKAENKEDRILGLINNSVPYTTWPEGVRYSLAIALYPRPRINGESYEQGKWTDDERAAINLARRLGHGWTFSTMPSAILDDARKAYESGLTQSPDRVALMRSIEPWRFCL